VIAPHPPHIFDTFMPILGKFGNLHEHDKLKVFIDHVCTYVERNQVPWTDVHNQKLQFDRAKVFSIVSALASNLDTHKGTESSPEFLVALFDTIYNMNAAANGKRTWICKSMGMSRYHDILMSFYGVDRLRYIYLVRDPRDVAMSFKKTPVGDCHYYTIVDKWCQNQVSVSHIVKERPELVLEIRYESLLQDKHGCMEKLEEFLGTEILRDDSLNSVLDIREIGQRVGDAKDGREAQKAAVLSYQFKNLVQGDEFAKQQFQKWCNGPEPLGEDDLILIESVAFKVMQQLGYDCHLVTKSVDPRRFTAEDIAEFSRLNAEAVKKMKEDLWVTDEGDAFRRAHQAEVVDFPATLLNAPRALETAKKEHIPHIPL